MKNCIAGLALAAAGLLLLPCVVTGGGLPSPEMFQAESKEELRHLLRFGEHDHPKQQPQQRRSLQQAASQPFLASSFNDIPGFYHGVASGDPLPSAVILWTRYTPKSANDTITLELRIAEISVDSTVSTNDLLDPRKNPKVRRANIDVTGASDWVAKVDVTGLPSRTSFVYAFSEGTVVSEIGQTKTAPRLTDDTVEQMQYAVFSCANFGNGYFHAYDIASTIKDLDFWVHVGDYIYEHGDFSTFASDSAERKAQVLPTWEIVELQDYRLRYATYHSDEGLRNLRRRAPMIAIWDDHETANNAYGQGTADNTGAENHQPVCSANTASPNTTKGEAKCDRNEGDAATRFNRAAQAYMEWLPIRRGPGTMGVITNTSITQTIEWGKLATLVAFDTRVSFRSKEPTVRDNNFDAFSLAFDRRAVRTYTLPPLKGQFKKIADDLKAEINNPKYTMIGKNIEILGDAFAASRSNGKIWQIWAGSTMMAPHIGPNLLLSPRLISNPFTRVLVRAYIFILLRSKPAGLARALVAMAQNEIPFNADDFNGFGAERAAILKIAKENSTNPIILGGDLHDSWAWILHEGGNITGTPVAVNLGCPGVTSPGFGAAAYPLLQALERFLGGPDGVFQLLNGLFKQQNPGLVFGDTQYKGFYAVKATQSTHTAEYIHIKRETILSDFATARSASRGIVANFTCAASLQTTAGQRGSLVKQKSCSAIEFDTERPSVWSIPYPVNIGISNLPKLFNCDMDACTLS